MALDEKLRRQLIAARESIGAQLTQLEGAKIDPYDQGGMPDCRKVYADLQRELFEIDALLESDGDGANISDVAAYQPMVRWNPDGTVGNSTGPTKAAIIAAVLSVGLLAFCITLGLVGR